MFKIATALLFVSIFVFSGCGSDNEALVSFQLVQPTYALDNIVITAKDGLFTRVIDKNDYDLSGATYKTARLRTMQSGELQISFDIYDGISRQVEPEVQGAFSVELKSDWFWSFDFVVSDMNPFDFCMGCSGYRAYALPETLKRNENDSLFVIWGGNSIKNPVIY